VLRSWGIVLTLALTLALIAAGCGGESAAKKAQTRHLQALYLDRGVKAAEQRKAVAEAQVAYSACSSQIGHFVSALDDLNSRLDVGLTFSDYSTHVGNVRVAYDNVTWSAVPRGGCLSAGVNGENALNDYAASYNTWNNCISDINCSTDTVKPQLQAKWALASTQIGLMNDRFAALKQRPRIKPWSLDVPTTGADVAGTVYGRAAADLCGDNAPVRAVQPCQALKAVLVDGVTDRELGQFDTAVAALNQAYQFAPAVTKSG
jgi:hypothetical protein